MEICCVFINTDFRKKFYQQYNLHNISINSQQYDLHKNLCNKYFPTIKNSEIESEKEHP